MWDFLSFLMLSFFFFVFFLLSLEALLLFIQPLVNIPVLPRVRMSWHRRGAWLGVFLEGGWLSVYPFVVIVVSSHLMMQLS